MSRVSISHPTKIIRGTINLPASKSISNRALILQAIGKAPVNLLNLSTADDTVIMQQALQQQHHEIQVKNAGTCMRFLSAYFAAQQGSEITLLCDTRMEQRPVHLLVNALREIGAEISYLKKEGFPPLRIKGKKLAGGSVAIDAGISSQYISALMMIAPLCDNGLTIELTGTVSSRPYIDMTAQMMIRFGFDVIVDYPFIHIRQSTNQPTNQSTHYTIEPDWSAAGYWYEIAALSKGAEVLLEGLQLNSLQGDKIVAEQMEYFGVETEQTAAGIVVRKKITEVIEEQNTSTSRHNEISIDLADTPDLAPALAVTAAALDTNITLTGLQNLAIKESNRLQAIAAELTTCGFTITATASTLVITHNTFQPLNPHAPATIQTYGDHRMAMAFAPLALLSDHIVIADPGVVDKSYPHFWNDLQKTGFSLKS